MKYWYKIVILSEFILKAEQTGGPNLGNPKE
jgi:hypothetical protein